MHPGIFAQSQPDKPAYIMADSGLQVTYRELNDSSNQGAQLFRGLGLKPGDAIAILMENHPRFLQICWAAQRAGLYYTAISHRLTASEAAYIVNDCGAKIFISSKQQKHNAQAIAKLTDKVNHFFLVDDEDPLYANWEKAIAEYPTEPIADEMEGADMLYSSGTTGRPKGIQVPLPKTPLGTPGALISLLKTFYITDDDPITYLSPAPLYHAAPLRYNMCMHRLGGTAIIMEQFDAEAALALIQKYQVTHSQWVPTMFVRMLKLAPEIREQYDVSSLRFAIHAAAPCPVPVKEKMIEWWGPIIFEYYAGTEGNGFTSITAEEWLTHKGSVGKAILGIPHILDDTGNELPAGEVGTIYFSDGPEFSYHNDEEKTASSRNELGWSTLGDVGYLDEEGYLYLTDRKAYTIISGGVNIYPQEAEDILVTHPKVVDVAVFGVPNEEFGEEVKAVVQPADMVEATPELEQELLAFCRSQLSAIKCPRSIDFEPELPRHPTGKLYKRLLKDRYWSKP
ncbi:MAG: AMP-binding protein [Pseudomonadales bacterium]|nr:AMP-binding protein [Pseudomonadales bacterium]